MSQTLLVTRERKILMSTFVWAGILHISKSICIDNVNLTGMLLRNLCFFGSMENMRKSYPDRISSYSDNESGILSRFIPLGLRFSILTHEGCSNKLFWSNQTANDETYSVDYKTEDKWKIFLQEKSKLVQHFKFLWGGIPASKGAYHSGYRKVTSCKVENPLEDSVYFGY